LRGARDARSAPGAWDTLAAFAMGYWTYYLAWMLVSYAVDQPWMLAGVVVFFALRRFLPDPWLVARTWGRIRALDAQISANPANVTARRDLALIWLERLRPRRALALLDEARARHADDAELLYLTGLARLRSGDAAGALDPLVKAVEIDPRVRFGEPYLVAAEALTALRRYEEAEDALDRYTHLNSSSLQGWVRLADVRGRRGDKKGADEARREAIATWRQVPGYRRRGELGWWFRSQWGRLFG
jgi:tetratricopeptide (TPR) repeat protein